MSTQATGFSPDQVTLPAGNFIGGQYIPGDGAEYDVIRPSDGHVIRSERGASANLVDRAVTAAVKAYKTSGWAEMPPRARAKVLFRWADLIDQNLEEMARLESLASCRLINETRHFDIGVRRRDHPFLRRSDRQTGWQGARFRGQSNQHVRQ